jgi:hypothetical protein
MSCAIDCQCKSRQGQCACGDALKLFLENQENIQAVWIKQPTKKSNGHMLEVFGLVVSFKPTIQKWVVHYAEFQKNLLKEEFDTLETAIAAGQDWLKNQPSMQ